MFNQASEVLRPGGELRIVGNGHLGYPAKLRRIYPHVEQVAANPRFMVLKALKSDKPSEGLPPK
jgi:16S rRNA (guanine1207-N2)-methyltransferase